MIIRTILLFFLIVTAAGLLGAQDPRPVAEALPVGDLLVDLGSTDFARRQTASAELVRRGREVVPALEAARPGLALEARLRVDQILARITTEPVRERTRLEATRVTLKIEKRPLSMVLERLGELGGTKIKYGRARASPRIPTPSKATGVAESLLISFEVADLPFYEALDRLCRDNGFVFSRDGRTGAIQIMEGTPPVGSLAYAGPIRAEIRSFNITRQLRSTGELFVNAYLQIQVDVEDTAPVLGILSPLVASKVEDDTGKSLLPTVVPTHFYMVQNSLRHQFNLSMTIVPPGRDARLLKHLVCPLKIVVPTSTLRAHLIAPFIVGQRSDVKNSLELTVDDLKTSGDTMTITVSFVPPKPTGDVPSTARVNAPEELVLLDAEGTRITPRSLGRRVKGQRQVRIITLQSANLAQIKLKAVESYETRLITLEFKDIEIP